MKKIYYLLELAVILGFVFIFFNTANNLFDGFSSYQLNLLNDLLSNHRELLSMLGMLVMAVAGLPLLYLALWLHRWDRKNEIEKAMKLMGKPVIPEK